MFSVSLRLGHHVRHYSISARPGEGWEVRREEDQALTRHARYRDWHRVELAQAALALEVSQLTAVGWEIVSDSKPADR
jgi:hypothetical protein